MSWAISKLFTENRFVALAILLILILSSMPAQASGETLKVGLYQHSPTIFLDNDGVVKGFNIDVIEHIASEEGWKIEYVPCTWPEALEKLETGEIDLVTDIAYTEERSNVYDFTNQTLRLYWGQAYIRKDFEIRSILDLDGKTVVGVKNSIDFESFKSQAESYGVTCNYTTVDEYETVLDHVENKKADTGIVDRAYGELHKENYGLYGTPIETHPIELYIATTKNNNQEILRTIDEYLVSMKGDRKSIYYQSQSKWFEDDHENEITGWIKSAMGVGGGLLLMFMIASLVLKDQVNSKTTALSIKNEKLEQEIVNHKKTEEELKRSKKLLQMKLDYTISSDRDLEDITLLDIIDLEHLQTIQDTFAKTNGVASIITDTNGNPITRPSNFCKICQMVRSTEEGKRRCQNSDMILGEKAKKLMKPAYERCHSLGLIDASAPIIIGGKHIASWLIGQTNVKEIDPKLIEEYAREIGADVEDMLDAYNDVHQMSQEKFEDVLQLLLLFAKEISTLGYNNLKLIKEVNERKLAEEELKTSEAKYSTLVEGGNDGIVISQDGILKFINSKMAQMTGYPVEEVIGEPLAKYAAEDYRELVLERHKKRLENDQTIPSTYEIDILSKDGIRIPVEINATYIKYEGKPAAMAIFRDITERKNLDRMKDEFLSNVGHELKTPLVSIIGYNELMYDETLGPLSKQQKNAIEAVIRNSERLRRLIDSLLYLSLEKAGKVKYAFSPIHADEIIEKAIVQMIPQAKKKGLRVESNMPEDLPLIEGDRDYLTQLLTNLIDNSVKFTPSGGMITISANLDNKKLQIDVKDTGIGIPEEMIPHMFKLFHQLDGSATRKFEGTGLGMYICKSIAEIHGGKIWVESKEGEGTAVHVILPVSDINQ